MSKVVKFKWKIRNRLNRKKIKFQIFPIFSFWVIVIFVLKIVNFRWLFTITRTKKIGKTGKLIFHWIQHIAQCASFIKMGVKLRGGLRAPHKKISAYCLLTKFCLLDILSHNHIPPYEIFSTKNNSDPYNSNLDNTHRLSSTPDKS